MLFRSLPNCKAFVQCDKVIFDAITNCPTVIGLFSELAVFEFPGATQPFFLYLQLTDGMVGMYQIEIEIQDLDNGLTLHKAPAGVAKFSYRPERYDVIMFVPPIRFEKPTGRCAVVAFTDGKMLAENTFTIRCMKE